MELQYYRFYKKSLRDLKIALENSSDFLKHCGMNNITGVQTIIEIVLKDPDILMLTGSISGYEVPEKYWKNYDKWRKKQIEKYKNGGISK